jgi:ankyrin repeat protein
LIALKAPLKIALYLKIARALDAKEWIRHSIEQEKPNLSDSLRELLLEYAIVNQLPSDTIKPAIQKLNFEKKDIQYRTLSLLHQAVIFQNDAAAKLLLERGAPLNYFDNSMYSPFDYAILTKNKELLDRMLNSEQIKSYKSYNYCHTPYCTAAKTGDPEIFGTVYNKLSKFIHSMIN